MSAAQLLALLLGLAVLVAAVRLLRWQARAPAEERAPTWRLAVLLAAQPLCALLLYLTLMPPAVVTPAGTLVVATRNAERLPAGTHVVALPEADVGAAVERVPDLATALRRYPDVDHVRVVGEGLPPRDGQAARGLRLSFDPAPLTRGIVRLDPPSSAAPGAAFAVTGRVAGLTGTVELLDPAGRLADSAPVAEAGDFTVRGTARGAGVALFKLRLRDASRRPIEEANVPLVVVEAAQPRLLLIAGAPGPEPKFLRRWAADAGLPIHAHYPTGGGIAIGDGPVALTASSLARFDVAILDERSWAALGAGERTALVGAVRGGLGLLLRVTGPLPDATRRQWAALGFTVTGGGDAAETKLRAGDGVLSRRSIRSTGRDLVPLLRDATNMAVASWRQEGRGRVAVWPITDSYALALAGGTGRYAELWSGALTVLSRPRSAAGLRLDGVARAGQRMGLCGVSRAATVTPPSATPARLIANASGCAAYWPAEGGWHLLRDGAAGLPFHVEASDALPAMRAGEARGGTQRIAVAHNPPAAGAMTATRRGASWPWFLSWVAVSAMLWRFERRGAKTGHRPTGPSQS
ncbi:carboxypeptidase regulatory-like domain-containing protein [Sphingoaurantiacus capsulatus]|uniref:Carboxypeptidase regulatory-like domain-containing protein n=1 Tax=Sphingoaurantiacus capsulatus TaxID=1771310 RepID=A0ABV7XD15_9SPHN